MDFTTVSIDYKSPDFYEQLGQTLKDGNKILCISWVQSEDGFEIDLDQIFQWCKEFEIPLVLDGTQGLGAIPFEVDKDVSMVFLSSSFKWLLSGYGVAVGYVSDDLLPKFKAFQGWNSIDFGTGNAKTGAASLEVGNALFLNVLGLNEGLQMISEIGITNTFNKNQEYIKSLTKSLEQLDRTVDRAPGSRSSIIQLAVEEHEHQKLEDASIQTSKQTGVRQTFATLLQ